MTLKSALQQNAAALFREHGTDVTLSRPGASDGATFDSTTGTMTGGGSTDPWTGRGYFSDYESDDIDGTTIKVDDRKLLLQAQGLERPPKINDIVDDQVKILNVKRVRSGTTVIHYVCQTRG